MNSELEKKINKLATSVLWFSAYLTFTNAGALFTDLASFSEGDNTAKFDLFHYYTELCLFSITISVLGIISAINIKKHKRWAFNLLLIAISLFIFEVIIVSAFLTYTGYLLNDTGDAEIFSIIFMIISITVGITIPLTLRRLLLYVNSIKNSAQHEL